MVVTYLTDVALLDHGMKENSTLSSLIQNHLKPGHGISSSLSVQSSWTLSNFLFVNIQRFMFANHEMCDFSQWGNWRKGRFLGAELLMFIALFKKNKKLLNPGIELMLHNVLL
ncbi:unnamed protein product, partial [Vitis vinifera]